MNAPMGPRPNPSCRHQRPPISAPAWVEAYAPRASSPDPAPSQHLDGLDLMLWRGPHATRISVNIPKALELSALQLEQRVGQAYRLVREHVRNSQHPHPVRFWNMIPGIHDPMDSQRDRYMVFNAGRFMVLSNWFGTSDQAYARLPAASAVGHDCDVLSIHCLSMGHPGQAVENPSQVPSFKYSHRYGPLPPCFARATQIDDPRTSSKLLLVAGTASILGECSVYQGRLDEQLTQTVDNLRALLGAAGEHEAQSATSLRCFADVRAYCARHEHLAQLQAGLGKILDSSARIEVLRADLCRSDLLVEIEGVAVLNKVRPT